ncbi:MAG: EAL domain-containing protein [Erysipelotrichaceae bacterium]|nr:EAL domain-containing protein [Erysipelotrichaceae bacterium]
MKKRSVFPIILGCIFLALSGVAFGFGITFLALITFASAELAYLPYSLYAISGGLVLIIIALLILILNKRKGKEEDPFQGEFLKPHVDLLETDVFLKTLNKQRRVPVGAIGYLILSTLSEDERAEISARINEIVYLRIRDFFPEESSTLGYEKGVFRVYASKGDIRAKMEEVAKQTIASFALDPTLPDLRLLLGLEANGAEMEPKLRLEHAVTAMGYDALSRLSGVLSDYDPAMEIDYRGLTFDLQAALDENRVEISYAPLLNKANKTYAYRRVLRLFDPSRGLIEEDELRRLSDNIGQGDLLDRYALEKTLDDLALWDEGVRHKLSCVLLSIGKSSFYRASFLHELRRAFTERGFDLGRLCLAINGADLVSDEAYCASFSKRAHALGIKTAIVGFSSRCPLVRINEMNPDIVSFAPSFFEQDPRLGKAKIEVLKNTALTIASGGDEFATIPDLYPEKDVTPALALERLQNEEEFRR